MAQPSSSHRHDDRTDRHHRSERSSHSRHHRTISSTTLLLVLSLVLAVLAVMLSLPSGSLTRGAETSEKPTTDAQDGGLLQYLSPKRTQQLIARESAVAAREAEVARREAELLVGAPGGVIPSPSAVACPICPSNTVSTVFAPAQTVIKEIIKEEGLAPQGWAGVRAEEILDRELRIGERERDITKREESVNRREHDASRREGWIMEQLIALGNDSPQRVEEEYEYEQPEIKPRKVKKVREVRELPPMVVAETAYETETQVVVQTQTVTVPAPANTRRAAFPTPQVVSSSSTTAIPRTTSVQIVTEEVQNVEEEEEEEYEEYEEEEVPARMVRRKPRPVPTPKWFGGW